MPILLKRAYEEPDDGDGYRVLVDRLWPRGVAKEAAALDDWLKDVAPSDALREAYHAGDLKWAQFRRRYLGELKTHGESLRPLARRAREAPVTLVFAARDPHRNNAVVLRSYLRMLGGH
jgi:uncharacterized protein YeaO (DUF488 family)